MTLKKTAYEILTLLRDKIDRLCASMEARCLFPQRPRLHFSPAHTVCQCSRALVVFKTRKKRLVTLAIGQFEAVEIQKVCRDCGKHYRSAELRSLTPHRGQFGFDVIEHIGKALFVHCRDALAIQADLAAKNIAISTSEIGFLGKRFIVYLALAHRASQAELKRYMDAKGGYILHMDGTCEGGSPHLFSCIDAISNIVLGNRKMPTEDSQYIIPLLKHMKAAYGSPVALVHDMGKAILKAVASVFPGIPDYICHFHFLRDLGKDLFDFEYRTIRRYTRSYNIGKTLKRALKQLKATIDDDQQLTDSLNRYLTHAQVNRQRLDPRVAAYLVVAWIIEYDSASDGLGFPFDRPHLEFYRRIKTAYPELKLLQAQGVSALPTAELHRLLKDGSLNQLVPRMEEKIARFDELRDAMRIAAPDSHRGLNDEGDDDMKTIEARVKQFRHAEKIALLANSDVSYRKMVKQIDQYWDKLFADPIEVQTPTGNIVLQPQRTNNLLEQSFRFEKRLGRKRSGQRALDKTLTGMLADTPLVRNLDNPDYLQILLRGKKNLAERFADIDIQLVRQEEKENATRWKKYPNRMRELFKVPHLPEKIMKTALK